MVVDDEPFLSVVDVRLIWADDPDYRAFSEEHAMRARTRFTRAEPDPQMVLENGLKGTLVKGYLERTAGHYVARNAVIPGHRRLVSLIRPFLCHLEANKRKSMRLPGGLHDNVMKIIH